MASGSPNPAWASQIPRKEPVRSITLYARSSGTRVICRGTTSSPITTAKRRGRPGNRIQAKA